MRVELQSRLHVRVTKQSLHRLRISFATNKERSKTVSQVIGSNFISGSIVQWGGSVRPTTFVSDTHVTAQISSRDVSTAGPTAAT